jgi:hypothetical protein
MNRQRNSSCLFFISPIHFQQKRIFWQNYKQFPKNNIIFAESAKRQMGSSLQNEGPFCFLRCFYKPKTIKE